MGGGRGRKGLSREEKLERLEALLLEHSSAMTLKELEKRASKEKGIVSRTVKEIAQELVDDGVINLDKIGSSNYYWAFPSQALKIRLRKKENLEAERESLKRRIENLEEEEDKLLKARNDPKRGKKLARLAELQEEETNLDESLKVFAQNDPDLLKALEQDVKEAEGAARRWTDNVELLRDFLVRKKGMERKRVDQGLGLTGIDEDCFD